MRTSQYRMRRSSRPYAVRKPERRLQNPQPLHGYTPLRSQAAEVLVDTSRREAFGVRPDRNQQAIRGEEARETIAEPPTSARLYSITLASRGGACGYIPTRSVWSASSLQIGRA